MSLEMDKLVNKYWNQIQVDRTDYEPVDDADRDAAWICLAVPRVMLQDYQQLNGEPREKLPNGGDFWKDTQLCARLRQSPKPVRYQHEHLADLLIYLGRDVRFDYDTFGDSTSLIRLSIYEDLELVYRD